MMPTFAFTGPDSKTYEIDGPEGSTPEQAFAILQQHLGNGPAPEKKDRPRKLRSAAPMEAETETAASALTGMVAKPVSDVAGLASIPAHAMGMMETTPQEVKKNIQSLMTYEPKTKEGKELVSAFGTIGEWWDRMSRAAGEFVAPPKTSGPLQAGLGYAVQGAVQEAPQLLGAKSPGAGVAASRVLREGAESSMQRALKPTMAEVKKGQAQTAIDTMLEQGMSVSKGGLRNIREKIDTLNDRITDVIQNSPAFIDRNKAAAYIQDTVNKFQNQVAPLTDVKAIQKVYDEFISINPAKIPVQTAQSLKKGTYQQLREKSYGELKSAEIEAQKAVARGLKDEIADAVSEVRPLSAEESKLLTALPMVERRVLSEANRNLAGFALLAHSTPKLTAFLADRSALFWSLTGRMLNKASEAAKTEVVGPATGTAVATSASDARQRREARIQRVKARQQEERALKQDSDTGPSPSRSSPPADLQKVKFSPYDTSQTDQSLATRLGKTGLQFMVKNGKVTGAGGTPVEVKTKEQLDALPSGTEFIDASGKKWRKP